MSVMNSLYTRTKSTVEDIELQRSELVSNNSAKRYSQVSQQGSTDDPSLRRLSSTQAGIWKSLSLHVTDTVEICLGEGNEAPAFRVAKTQLCQQSAYFRNILGDGTTRSLVFDREDPLVFELFHNWLKKQDPPVQYIPNVYSDDPWRSLAAQAWVLGWHLDANQFMRYALCQFIVNCALVDLGTWEFIEALTEHDSTLRRFSSHWVAWNVSLGQTEYASLAAASLADQVSHSTRDPRTYQVDHWNLPCADFLSVACDHNIGAKMIVNKRVKPPSPEIGRDWELGHRKQSNTSNTDTSISQPSRPSAPPPRPHQRYVPQIHRSPSPPPRSPSPRRASVYEPETSMARRFRHGFLIVCTILTVICLGLSVTLLQHTWFDDPLNYTLDKYAVFVTSWAVMLCLLHACCGDGQRLWLTGLDVLYWLLNFAAAVATAKDVSRCNEVMQKNLDFYFPANPCQVLSAFSGFTWLSLFSFVILSFLSTGNVFDFYLLIEPISEY